METGKHTEKFLYLVALICVFVTCVCSEKMTIGVAPTIVISPMQAQLKSNVGVVPLTRSCGGPGKILQWRYETCKEYDVPCRIPADAVMRKAEVDFIPSRDIGELGLRLTAVSNDHTVSREYNVESHIVNASVRAGQAYTIRNSGGVTEELKGKRVIFHYILYDQSNDKVEICAECELQFV